MQNFEQKIKDEETKKLREDAIKLKEEEERVKMLERKRIREEKTEFKIEQIRLKEIDAKKKREEKEQEKQEARRLNLIERQKRKEEERKIREAESNRLKKGEKIIKTSNPIKKNEKTLSNISNNREVTKKIIEKNTVTTRKSGKLIESKDFQTETTKSSSAKSLCNEIENCDIDKIAEILIQKGENKPFPNITSNNF